MRKNSANSDPVYVLMTLFGEQIHGKRDPKIHTLNRNAWNSWAIRALEKEKVQRLVDDYEFDLSELDTSDLFISDLENMHRSEMSRRNGSNFKYPGFPDPSNNVDLSGIFFPDVEFADKILDLSGFVFPAQIGGCLEGTRGGHPKGNFASIDFSNAIFLDTFSICPWHFGGIVCFEKAKFSGGLAWKHVTFEKYVNFSDAVFFTRAQLAQVYFTQKVCFRGAEFRSGLQTDGVKFAGCVNFHDVKIFGNAEFDDLTVFQSQVNFQGAKFEGHSQFKSSFLGPVKFDNADFKQPVNFRPAQFSKELSFRSSVFHSTILLETETFIESVDVSLATFNEAVDFSNKYFASGFMCEGATFCKSVNFQDTNFDGQVSFRAAEFGSTVRFNRAEFGVKNTEERCEVDFSDSYFMRPVSFRETKFRDKYPVFSGALLHDKSVVSTTDEYWPRKVEGPDLVEAKETCATLRHLLNKQGFPEDEHYFFRKEMEYSGRIGSIFRRFPYYLFGVFSDFGNSISRPALWLVAVWGLGGLGIWACSSLCFEVPLDCKGDQYVDSPWVLSFANIFPLFGFKRLYFGSAFLLNLSAGVKVISGIQTVLSLPLLFLFGLGIRQRFRLR